MLSKACTPKGIIALLENNNIEIKGKDVTIIKKLKKHKFIYTRFSYILLVTLIGRD